MFREVALGAMTATGVALGTIVNIVMYGFIWGVLLGIVGVVFGVMNGTFPDYVLITFADGVSVGVLMGLLATAINVIKLTNNV